MIKNVYSFICIKLSTLALLLSPLTSTAQAPVMGSTADFALYTTNGAVLNTSTTHITGNVGTNVGSNTGFGNVNGVMHSGNGTTLLAATDLQQLFTQLDTITSTATLPLLLADTVNPGVFSIPGNASITQSIVLDAQGDSSGVFIFQIDGGFSTASAAEVVLINGAQACNIFWKTENVVSLATNTVMKGTIVANNAAINMSSGTDLEGRALSIAGAITINGVKVHTPKGCGSALLTGPLAPALGTIECYALFSADGPVANAGITNITGDVGTNLGSTTGYDLLLVNGVIHPIPDTSTITAAADLANVYTYLNGLTHDIELLYPAQFGNNLTLTPHTYLMTGATTFTDTLYLDAEGNTDAIFVMKLNGALITSTYSAVMLINGAQARNVYWKIDGAVEINDHSDFVGTIISNGAIDFKTGTSLAGRALTNVGALSTTAMSVVIPTTACFPLSVDWISFTGSIVHQQAILEWVTTNEMDNGFFTLDKSNDGKSFETVTTVNAADGRGTRQNHYSYTDQLPYKYYRIAQTDNNVVKKYYRVIALHNNQTTTQGTVTLYPNPFSSMLSINSSDASETNSSELHIYNVMGELVMQAIITQRITDIKTELPAGVYYYNMTNKDQTVQSGKIVSVQ